MAVPATSSVAGPRSAVAGALAATPMADIQDVYAWMQSSQILNLVMDVSPQDDGSTSFGPGVTYVFHLTSKADPEVPTAVDVETRVLCQFASATSVQCWVTDPASAATVKGYKAYLRGDPSAAAGVQTTDRKLKVFAGRRSDPRFFNATGFATAIAQYKALAVAKAADPAGCPVWLTGAQADSLLTTMRTGGDTFAGKNVMALVVQIDTTLINAATNKTVAVWGATHAAP
ncbi:MAG: DUF4331 family protein [Myxococcales bacterium]|nr:DUF4331 family protein [Myxococcales bacterium]